MVLSLAVIAGLSTTNPVAAQTESPPPPESTPFITETPSPVAEQAVETTETPLSGQEHPECTDTETVVETPTPGGTPLETPVATQPDQPVPATELPTPAETPTAQDPAGEGTAPESTVAPQVVGGTEASPGAWPWMVALVHHNDSNLYNGQFCGGSLIGESWVLTAAHCVYDQSPAAIDVVAGIHNLTYPEDGYQRIAVASITLHPGFTGGRLINDIALLRLAHPAILGGSGATRVGTVSLANETMGTLAGFDSVVTGWGSMYNKNGPYPDALRQAHVSIYSNSVCNNSLHYAGTVSSNELCAGYESGGYDTCNGDSGGPLVILYGSAWWLAGITSWGDGCANPYKPGVYVRISSHASWIQSISGISSLTPRLSRLSPKRNTSVMVPFTLSLVGRNFGIDSQVIWNGIPVPTAYHSRTLLTAVIPAYPSGNYRVWVQNLTTGGISSGQTFSIRNPKPVIRGLSQAQARVYDGAVSLVITGDQFVSNSVVYWNKVALPTTYVSRYQLNVTLSASFFLKAVKNNIKVGNPSPGGGKSRNLKFAVLNPVPILSTTSPASLVVNTPAALLLVGDNFVPKTKVYWNGKKLSTRFVDRNRLVIQATAKMLKNPSVVRLYVISPRPGGGGSQTITVTISLSPPLEPVVPGG